MQDEISDQLLDRARNVIPGGVNSPVRAFGAVGGSPVFVREAHGAYLVGADGTQYVDFIGSWGPMILGHAHPEVVSAVSDAMGRGSSFGAPTEAEIELAEVICDAVPSIELVRMTSSGTEAVMGALRAARGFTGRDLVVKFEGCYHGGADYLLVKAGSGAATFGHPDSAGVPASIASTTIVLPYNDSDAVRQLFVERGKDIAALILEPIAGNMGCVPPQPRFLETCREVTEASGSVLVFDEVMTGFRVDLGGAQCLYGVAPDLTTLGKVIGGGLPVGAFGGRRDIMSTVAPLGPVYQAGTLSGNPLAVVAGLTTLSVLRSRGAYALLEQLGAQLEGIMREGAEASGVEVRIQRVGSMLTPHFNSQPVRSWTEAASSDTAAFARWHRALLDEGVYWPASQYEAGFVSLAHQGAPLEAAAGAFRAAFAAAKR